MPSCSAASAGPVGHETDRLARNFDGMLFSDRSIDDLVECIEAVTA